MVMGDNTGDVNVIGVDGGSEDSIGVVGIVGVDVGAEIDVGVVIGAGVGAGTRLGSQFCCSGINVVHAAPSLSSAVFIAHVIIFGHASCILAGT